MEGIGNGSRAAIHCFRIGWLAARQCTTGRNLGRGRGGGAPINKKLNEVVNGRVHRSFW